MSQQKDKEQKSNSPSNSPSEERSSESKNFMHSTQNRHVIAKEVMTKNAAVCSPDMSIKDCANLMLENDCGEIPIVESDKNCKLVGVITDRDITCRVVAKGKDPINARVKDFMTKDIFTVKENDDLERCAQLMSEKQVRRLPVVDEKMNVVGIVSQAHVARYASIQKAGELAKNISRSRSSHHISQANQVNM